MSEQPNTEELQKRINELEDQAHVLAVAQQAAQLGSWDWDLLQNTMTWSDETFRQFGYTRGDVKPAYEAFAKFVHPDDLEMVNTRLQQAFDGERPYDIEARMVRSDGSLWYMHAQGTVYRGPDGQPVRIIVVQRDVTNIRQTVEELRLQEEIIANMAEGVYLIRASDGIIVFANEKFEQMFGYDHGEMVGRHVSIVNAPTEKSPEDTALEIMNDIRSKGSWQGEVYNARKDGAYFWCQASVSQLHHYRHGDVLISIHTDISERKAMEEALRESEKRNRLILGRSMDGFILSDNEGRITDANEAFSNLVGYPRESLQGMPITQLEAKESPDDVAHHIEKIIKTGNDRFETQHRHRDGHLVDIEISVNYDRALGNIFFSFVRDISSRKMVEKTLRENEEKFRLIFESSLDAIYQMDKDGTIIFMNRAGGEMFGYTPEEIVGNHFGMLVTEESVSEGQKALKKALAGNNVQGEISVRQRHGYRFTVSYSLAPIKKDDQIVGVTGISRDITDRLKEEERQLRESLAEKESLLKEIHHRVKNNMQIVSSLLSLQSMRSTNPEVQTAIKDSQNRVKTMGLIHEKLYKTENLSRIDFNDYIKTLTEYLSSTYATASRRVKIAINAKDIFLSADTAIPCGLIITELVTNSFKYAFGDQGMEQGRIEISLTKAGDKRLEMVVSDNGHGLPQGFDIANADSLGMSLVQNLARQLGAKLSFSNGEGAVCKMEFAADGE